MHNHNDQSVKNGNSEVFLEEGLLINDDGDQNLVLAEGDAWGGVVLNCKKIVGAGGINTYSVDYYSNGSSIWIRRDGDLSSTAYGMLGAGGKVSATGTIQVGRILNGSELREIVLEDGSKEVGEFAQVDIQR